MQAIILGARRDSIRQDQLSALQPSSKFKAKFRSSHGLNTHKMIDKSPIDPCFTQVDQWRLHLDPSCPWCSSWFDACLFVGFALIRPSGAAFTGKIGLPPPNNPQESPHFT